MSTFKTNTLVLDQRFDSVAKQHHLNGRNVVFHCHHYTSLYTQLAVDAQATGVLSDTAEDSFLPMLNDYFAAHGVSDVSDKIDLACQYYTAIGLGVMTVAYMSDYAAEIVLTTSHVDEGWIKKWGPFDRPVNFITAGFATALCSAALGLPGRTFHANEVESLVTGASQSRFRLVRK